MNLFDEKVAQKNDKTVVQKKQYLNAFQKNRTKILHKRHVKKTQSKNNRSKKLVGELSYRNAAWNTVINRYR